MAKIIIPTPLRKFTQNERSFETAQGSVADAIDALTAAYPEVKRHLLDDDGKLRTFVKVYLGDEDIAMLDGAQTTVSEQSIISIIPAIAGGM